MCNVNIMHDSGNNVNSIDADLCTRLRNIEKLCKVKALFLEEIDARIRFEIDCIRDLEGHEKSSFQNS